MGSNRKADTMFRRWDQMAKSDPPLLPPLPPRRQTWLCKVMRLWREVICKGRDTFDVSRWVVSFELLCDPLHGRFGYCARSNRVIRALLVCAPLFVCVCVCVVCLPVRQKYSPPTYTFYGYYDFFVLSYSSSSFLYLIYIFFFRVSPIVIVGSLSLPPHTSPSRCTMHQTVISFDCSSRFDCAVRSDLSGFFLLRFPSV